MIILTLLLTVERNINSTKILYLRGNGEKKNGKKATHNFKKVKKSKHIRMKRKKSDLVPQI